MRRDEIAKKLERVEKELRELKEEVRQGRQYIPIPYPQPYPVPYYPQPYYPWWGIFPRDTTCGRIDQGDNTTTWTNINSAISVDASNCCDGAIIV